MPVRLLREGILTSDRVDELDAAAEVFYRRLMSKVDDFGLYDARPSVLRASLYPLRIDRVREADIARWIAACEKAGVIALYQHDGKPYLQMLDTRWTERSKPKFPLPPDPGCDTMRAGENTCEQPQTVAPVFEVVVVGEDDKSSRKRPPTPDGVSDAVWQDFLKLRRAKKAPVTDTAIAGIAREAAKAGITLDAALQTCCLRGWQGFKAEWVADARSGVGVTVPGSNAPDPALEKIKADAEKAVPPSPEVRAAMATLVEKMKKKP